MSGCCRSRGGRGSWGMSGAFRGRFRTAGIRRFESHDAGGMEAGDLAAEFGADGAGGAGDEDDFALEHRRIWLSSRRTGFRPKRSSTATSRIWPASPRSSITSPKPGTVLHSTPAAWQSSRMRVISVPVAEGMAIRIVSTSCFLTSERASPPPPSTDTPRMRAPRFSGRSSRNPRTRYGSLGLF